MPDDIIPINAVGNLLAERMATLEITLDGEQGTLAELVPYDASEADLKTWAAEAVRGGLAGIDPQDADFTDFRVKRIPAKDGLPDRLALRPKTPFGA